MCCGQFCLNVNVTKNIYYSCAEYLCANDSPTSDGTTRPLPKDGGAEEFRGDLTVGLRPKVWTRDQKWKK